MEKDKIMSKVVKLQHSIIIALFVMIILIGCGGGSGDNQPTGGNQPPAGGGQVLLSGTAATGKPIANAVVTVKDKNGTAKTGTTDANGKYTIDVNGLTAPFLLKVDLASSGSLFSVGGQTGVVNIHPLTDLIIETWYKVQGKTIDTAFSDPVSAPPPTATEIELIAAVVEDIVQKWLTDNGLDPNTFDLITTPFDADGSGFDNVLDSTQVDTTSGTITIKDDPTNPTVTQTTTLTVNQTTSSVTSSTTTTSANGTSQSTTSAIIPTTSALQTAVDGVNASLGKIKDIVNSKGNALADTDLLPFLSQDFLEEGENRAISAAEGANDLRGVTINSFSVIGIHSFDETNKIISVEVSSSETFGGVTETFTETFSFKQVGADWLIYGDQSIVNIILNVGMQTDITGSGTSTNKVAGVFVIAPKGTVSKVAVSGGGIFSDTDVPTNGTRVNSEILPSPNGQPLTIEQDTFGIKVDLSSFPAPGTAFTFTITPVSGSPITQTVTTGANTTDSITITSPTGHTLATDAKLGQPLSVTWTLPKTFTVDSLDFFGNSRTSNNVNCTTDTPDDIGPTSTSGTVTLPSTCQGEPIVDAWIIVEIEGTNGESTSAFYFFQ